MGVLQLEGTQKELNKFVKSFLYLQDTYQMSRKIHSYLDNLNNRL
jgi:hypothetical protein